MCHGNKPSPCLLKCCPAIDNYARCFCKWTNIKLVSSNAAFRTKSELHKSTCWFTFDLVLFDKTKHIFTQYMQHMNERSRFLKKFKETFEINTNSQAARTVCRCAKVTSFAFIWLQMRLKRAFSFVAATNLQKSRRIAKCCRTQSITGPSKSHLL